MSSLAASHPAVSSLTTSGFAVNDPAASRSTENNPVVSKPAAIDPAAIDSIASDPTAGDPTESDPASRSSPATGKPAAITFTTPPAALELRGIAKRFGATRVGRYTHPDHPALAAQLYAAYARAVQARVLASVVGEEGRAERERRV